MGNAVGVGPAWGTPATGAPPPPGTNTTRSGLSGPAAPPPGLTGKVEALPPESYNSVEEGLAAKKAAEEAAAQAQRDFDEARARALAQGLAAAATPQPPRPAPVVAAPPPVAVTTAAPTTVATTAGPTAGVVAAPAPLVAPVIGGTNIDPAATYRASTVAPTTAAHASLATATTVDPAMQAQLRAQQQQLFAGIQATADGQGLTAADLTAQKATDAAIAAQRSAAAGAHGTGVVGARWQANNNIATISQKAAADAAILRAKEQETARGQLITGLDAARGQDIGLATTDATLKTDVSKTNAGNLTSVDLANVNADNVRNLKIADLEQAANAGNTLAINERARRQAELDQQRLITDAGNKVDVDKASADAALRAGITNANNQTTTSISGSEIAAKAAATQAELDTRTKLANAGFENTGNLADADNQLKVGLANAGFTLKGRELDDARNVAAVDAALKAQGQVLTSDAERERNAITREQLAAAVRSGDRDAVMKIVGTVLTVGGALGGAAIGGPAGAVAGGTAGAAVTKGIDTATYSDPDRSDD